LGLGDFGRTFVAKRDCTPTLQLRPCGNPAFSTKVT
jgi:hypothetical protein